MHSRALLLCYRAVHFLWIALGASFKSPTIGGVDFLNVLFLWIALGASIKNVTIEGVDFLNGGVLR